MPLPTDPVEVGAAAEPPPVLAPGVPPVESWRVALGLVVSSAELVVSVFSEEATSVEECRSADMFLRGDLILLLLGFRTTVDDSAVLLSRRDDMGS